MVLSATSVTVTRLRNRAYKVEIAWARLLKRIGDRALFLMASPLDGNVAALKRTSVRPLPMRRCSAQLLSVSKEKPLTKLTDSFSRLGSVLTSAEVWCCDRLKLHVRSAFVDLSESSRQGSLSAG